MAEQANRTAARTWWVVVCLGWTVLTSAVLAVDLCLPEPWGGLTSRQPWAVAGVMLLINSLSIVLIAGWLVHLLYVCRIPQKIGLAARTTWRDFLYWTVEDVKECA
jgi:hypothetical protein